MEKQLLFFIFGCLTVRAALAILAAFLPPEHILRYFGIALMIPAIGFAVIYIAGLRETGAETFGKPLWWNHMRPIHAGMYFTAAVLAMGGSNYASVPLAADVIVGAIASAIHYASIQ